MYTVERGDQFLLFVLVRKQQKARERTGDVAALDLPKVSSSLELHILEINSFQVKSNFEVAFRKPRKCSQKFQMAYGALLDSKVNLTVILDNARIRYSAFLMKFQMKLEIGPL